MAISTPTRERVMTIEIVIASGKANRGERYECDGGGGGDGGDVAGGGDTRMAENSKSARRSRRVPAGNGWRDATDGGRRRRKQPESQSRQINAMIKTNNLENEEESDRVPCSGGTDMIAG
ncbi:hypothetical protein CYMTET_9761 [Cymbomonas tetramitiformis]|uniref:Uncharacterized protein n=1 Tax=Cymbomonas tetramitiformis TaxID=36881 RepID=A0AAE0GS26_9CHLO|nr:hypothetical protein CYMTET_9761 [Cymbomonas tetramitiformis]